jgi:hypothetical protein
MLSQNLHIETPFVFKQWFMAINLKPLLLKSWHTQFKGNLHRLFFTLLLQFVLPPWPSCLITSLNDFLTIHACHDPSLQLITKARAYKGVGQKCKTRVTFAFPECQRVWRNEPTHSLMDSHLGNWSPYGTLNFQKMILRVKTHWIEEFLTLLEISWDLNV